MACNNLLFYLFGILSCFAAVAVAHEAIINGDRAAPDQLRYQVSVQIPDAVHTCGGGIIGERFILTAAHCVIDQNGHFIQHNFSIIAGTNDLHRTRSPAERVPVVKIYVPAEYDPAAEVSTSDIAILKLKTPLRLRSQHQHLVQLQLPVSGDVNYVGLRPTIAGFGRNGLNHPTDGHLRFAAADVIDHDHPAYPHGRNPHWHVCAQVVQRANEQRGVCDGDTGSPLVNHGVAIGVLSKPAPGCAEHKTAATYTRVSRHLPFISKALLDIPSPAVKTHVVPQ